MRLLSSHRLVVASIWLILQVVFVLLSSSSYSSATKTSSTAPSTTTLPPPKTSQKPVNRRRPPPSPPTWLTPRLTDNRELFAHYLELARERHNRAIRQAQESYFHGNVRDDDGNKNDAETATDNVVPSNTLSFDEYHLQGDDVVLPDFNDELDPTLFVTSKSTPMFSREECAELIRMAESHFKGEWTRLPSGQYDVAGFWIRDVPAVHEWFNTMLQERLFPNMMSRFPDFCNLNDGGDMSDLCVDNAYLFRYTPETGRRTDTHTDSGCLSFTIALNPKEEYRGGGTWFESLEKDNGIIEMDVGQVTLRPGGVRHCGHAVTEGTRYIIGGFCMNRNKVEHVRMLLQLAHDYSAEGSLEKAQEALEASILLNPSYDGPYAHLSDILTKRGDEASAKRALQYCLENVNPRSQETAYSLASKLLIEENYDEARKYLQICLYVDPMDVEAMEAMSQVFTGLNDPMKEFEMYQQIISIPDVKPEILSRVYCNLGVLSQGKDEEIVFFKKSLEMLPSSFPASYSLGCAYAARGQWEPAIQWFRHAVEVADDGSDSETKSLRTLYTTVAKKLQEETNQQKSVAAPSQQEMVRIFSDLMGASNFEKITKLMRP